MSKWFVVSWSAIALAGMIVQVAFEQGRSLTIGTTGGRVVLALYVIALGSAFWGARR